MRKIRTRLAVPVLMAAIVLPTAAVTGQAANADVVPAVGQYTCPAASATAPACFYAEKNFNDDYHPPLYPNTGYDHVARLYGVRNRNTVYYLCLQDTVTLKKLAIPPNPKGDYGDVADQGYGFFDTVYFHSNADC
jgi:hypothetical protein